MFVAEFNIFAICILPRLIVFIPINNKFELICTIIYGNGHLLLQVIKVKLAKSFNKKNVQITSLLHFGGISQITAWAKRAMMSELWPSDGVIEIAFLINFI